MPISKKSLFAIALSTAALTLASCEARGSVESTTEAQPVSGAIDAGKIGPFAVTEHGQYEEPWALAFEPGSGKLFITEKSGQVKFFQPASGQIGVVSGIPKVDYGGQGGLGDIAFAPDYETSRLVYLSYAEAGASNTRGAAVGRGTMNCEVGNACQLENFAVIWRQAPKTTGRGHYSHRIAFSPDGQHLFIASGERQKMSPAQDTKNTLGAIVRLNLDGSPAQGNPLANQPSPTNEIWSYGHRNILGLGFDAQGRLWDVEHGPAGGDEFNLVKPGANYGWPVVSDGAHYDGTDIPDNATRPEFAQSAITWTPVIAPGGMIFYKGDLFTGWKGTALIAGLSSNALIHIEIEGENAHEKARYRFDNRIRGIAEAPDGAIWIIEDGDGGRLLRLTPAR